MAADDSTVSVSVSVGKALVEKVEIGIVRRDDGPSELEAAALIDPPKPWSKNMLWLHSYTLVSVFCSSLYGFDASLMGSLLVMTSFQHEFGSEVDGVKAAYITSMFQIGSVVSIPFIGESMDRFGRPFGMFIGCSIVIIAVTLQGTASVDDQLGQYRAGRFLMGFGTRLAGAAAPAYIVEISHPAYRGVMTGVYNCTYDVGGVVCAGVAYAALNYSGNQSWLDPTWIQILFAGIVAVPCMFMPESPRWMFTHGKKEKAREFIIKYHGEDNPDNAFVQLQLREFEAALDLGSNEKWWDYSCLFKTRGDRHRVLCNLTVALWSAWSSGGISNYIGAFYQSAGVTSQTTVLAYNLGASCLCAASAYVGAVLCQHIGRRTLMLISLFSVCGSWILMTVSTAEYANTGTLASAKAGIASYFIFWTCFAIGLTPLYGVYTSEVLSYRQRAKGSAVSVLVNSAAALVNQFGTPVAMERIGWKTYAIYTCWSAFEIVFSYLTMVETKGYTLEELDAIFASKNPVQESKKRRKVILGDVNAITEKLTAEQK